MGYLKERFNIDKILPVKPGTCPKCGRKHELDWPHDRDSLAYQYNFYDENGRWPSWADALEGCPPGVTAYWKEQLEARGIDVNAVPDTATMSFDVKNKAGKPAVVITVQKNEVGK